MTTTQKILFCAGALALFGGTAFAGYYWMQSNPNFTSARADTPRTVNVVNDAPVSLCARPAVTDTVRRLLSTTAPRNELLMTASDSKMEALNAEHDKKSAEFDTAAAQCKNEGQAAIQQALIAAGVNYNALNWYAENPCDTVLPGEHQMCLDAGGAALANYVTCMTHVRDELKYDSLDVLGSKRVQAMSRAVYQLEDIRTTAADKTTGANMCVANVTAKLPDDWGSATKELFYKVEVTSESKLYVTLLAGG